MVAVERPGGVNNSILRHAAESTPRSLYGHSTYNQNIKFEDIGAPRGKYYTKMKERDRKDNESLFLHEGPMAILGDGELVKSFVTQTGRVGYIHLSGEKIEVKGVNGPLRPLRLDDGDRIEGYEGDGTELKGEDVKGRRVFKNGKVIGEIVPMICRTSYQNAHTPWVQQYYELRPPKHLLKAASRKLEVTEKTFQAIQNLLIEKVAQSTHGPNKVISGGVKSRKIIHNVAHLQEVMKLLQDYFEAGERAKPNIKKRICELFDIHDGIGANSTQPLLDEVLAIG